MAVDEIAQGMRKVSGEQATEGACPGLGSPESNFGKFRLHMLLESTLGINTPAGE